MTIRKARKDEVRKLQELNDSVFEKDNLKYDADIKPGWGLSEDGKTYFTKLLRNTHGLCYVAEDNGTLVGYITAVPIKFKYRKSKYIEIENLGIAPEYRKQGIGHQLMVECHKWAKAKGYQKIFLKCFFKNEDALTFYKNYGFSGIYINLERDI